MAKQKTLGKQRDEKTLKRKAAAKSALRGKVKMRSRRSAERLKGF